MVRTLLLVLTTVVISSFGQPLSLDFERVQSMDKLDIKGAANVEPAPAGRDGKVLRIDPESKVVWTLRDKTASGTVSFWIYDDGTVTANPAVSQPGPRWGVIQADGRVLTAGVFYARYLKGAESYAASESDQKVWFSPIQYIAGSRKPRWSQWTFDFNPDSGCTISVDGQPIKRFDWNKTKSEGFTGVVFFGDDTDGDKNQTLWVDDVNVVLGGPMNVKPTPPPPPPPVLPEKDPVVGKSEVPVLKTDTHPRLIVTPETLPGLKAFYNSDEGRLFRENFLRDLPTSSKVPSGTPKFLKDATDGQRHGLWRLPTVALHYLLTGDAASFDATVGYMKWLMEQPVWEQAPEINSGMSSANVMIGAALAFDWTYNELDPEFREAFRKKLWYQARYQYHGGHLKKTPGTHYWQNDPQANHRWHRDAGLSLAVLAAYNGLEEQGWLLAETKQELEFISKWLADDGTSHESASYLVFGGVHLTLALQAADDCFGTDFLQEDFFANAPGFIISSCLPGSQKLLPYGDTGGELGNYKAFLFKGTSVHKKSGEQKVLLDMFKQDPKSFFPGWLALVWFDPSLSVEADSIAPLNSLWTDIGTAYMRTGWDAGNAAAMFRCSPIGGYKLNRFRNENNYAYINVAHDDPDANSFVLFNNGELIAETDRYSKAKRSANHNTILVNGMGQMVPGRMEPQVYAQPGKGDMTQMAVVTAWRDTDKVVAVEGEAAGSYLQCMNKRTGQSRPGIDRFRRTFLWVKGDYVLVLDDIRSAEAVDVTWLIQSGNVEPLGSDRFKLVKGDAACEFQVASDSEFSASFVDSSADHRGKNLGWKQLQLGFEGMTSTRIASAYDVWNRGKVEVVIKPVAEDAWLVAVRGDGFSDVWKWSAATGQFSPSSLEVSRKGTDDPFFMMNAGNAFPPSP